MIPTMHLRFVKRRVGKNVVRILQQLWRDDDSSDEGAPRDAWRDVELSDGDRKATSK